MTIKELVVRPHHTAFSCRDFEATKAFFVDTLGFKVLGVIKERGEPELATITGLPRARCHWAMLELGGFHIELFQWLEPAGGDIGLRQCDIGLTHLCFQVSDVAAVHRKLKADGWEPLSEPQVARGGRAKPFYCRGPEGVIIEFVEYPFGA
jgi:catechol 2,3-dioxygenase-like lactoylglutathione lyase family enzyme